MTNLKRVYLDDLVEEYTEGRAKLPRYATYHKDTLVDGPFTVFAAGRNKIVVVNDKNLCRTYHYTADIGLAPYESGIWNPTNKTYEVLPEDDWHDDWM